MKTTRVDVLIVGAGIPGIGAAYHLQKQCPDKNCAIIEARATGVRYQLPRSRLNTLAAMASDTLRQPGIEAVKTLVTRVCEIR